MMFTDQALTDEKIVLWVLWVVFIESLLNSWLIWLGALGFNLVAHSRLSQTFE